MLWIFLFCNVPRTIRRSRLRMIVKALPSKSWKPIRKEELNKRCKVVLSQSSILHILLGLIFTNIIVTVTHIVIYNKIFPKNDSVRQPNERRFPRIVFDSQTNATSTSQQIIAYRTRYVADMGNAIARRRISLQDEIDLDIVEDENCKLRPIWQKTFYPTCNSVHEFDGTMPWSKSFNRRQKQYRIIGNGFWRDVWIISKLQGNRNEKGVLKTMRYLHDYTPRNFDRMRRDSVTMEQLTKSPFIVNIYSFCGTSSLSEFGDGGDIQDALWPRKNSETLSLLDKLRIATQVAIAVATLHNFDKEGYPTVAHTDIAPAQFIKFNDKYKLNDFNRARFIPYDGDRMCSYSMSRNPGKNRSPEEYMYEPQTEKGEWPFYDVTQDVAHELVKNGTRPSIYSDLWFSDDPIVITLKEVMIMCHEHNASARPSARTVEQLLKERMKQLDPGTLENWGL